MTVFLTSSPMGDLDGEFQVDGIDYRNGFLDNLKACWKQGGRCLIATATPGDRDSNCQFADAWYDAFLRSGLECSGVDILDAYTADMTAEEITSYDLIVLGGGHVPTQNAFFEYLDLREKLEGYEGIIVGISAGSMNAADYVYAQPEEEGEAADPYYERWLRGLGLTTINVLPHYQMVKDKWLDGMRLFEDITCPDSEGNDFIALPDGSYLIIRDGDVSICGPAWKVEPWGVRPLWK